VTRFDNGPCGAAWKAKCVGLRVKSAQPRIDQSLPQLSRILADWRAFISAAPRAESAHSRQSAVAHSALTRHVLPASRPDTMVQVGSITTSIPAI
jgi:hypothetical protein